MPILKTIIDSFQKGGACIESLCAHAYAPHAPRPRLIPPPKQTIKSTKHLLPSMDQERLPKVTDCAHIFL